MTINEYQKMTGKTQKQLVEEFAKIQAGIDQPLVSKMIKGICMPSDALMCYISRADKGYAYACDKENNESGVIHHISDFERLKSKFEEVIYTALSNHDRVSMKDLAECLNISERQVRKLIELMRSNGIRIGADNDGYYLCETPEEYEAFEHYYLTQAYKKLYIAKRMRENNEGQVVMYGK